MPDPLSQSSSQPLQVAVIYNPEDTTSAAEVALADEGSDLTAKGIADSLQKFGVQTQTYAVSEKNLYYLKHKKADVFFNVCEGENMYMRVVKQLEKGNRVFTGPGPEVMALTVDKVATKRVLESIGVPTPAWQEFHTGKEPIDTRLHYPLIVKPTKEDCSIGITPRSIVDNEADLLKLVQETIERYKQSVLVEEFIPGKELHCTVVGNGEAARALPLAELQLTTGKEDENFIFDYEAKWVKDSPRYSNTFVSPAPSIAEATTKRIQRDARRAFLALGMKDYARFDVRFNTATGHWYFLEANANPSITNTMEEATVLSAEAHGLEYHEFIKHILDSCTKRNQVQPALLQA
jgi:D-alanine-D-alanine ligase